MNSTLYKIEFHYNNKLKKKNIWMRRNDNWGITLGGEMRRNIDGEFAHGDSPFFTDSGSPLVWIMEKTP